ncbi:MAG: hypothetical protein LUE64_05345 [Candidatus Gastranaerophilales bacterium]|nr:hypothetical protein [Candidatus Gastranaerophilales bacterium]
MQINKITSFASDISKKAGSAVLNNKPDGKKLSEGLRKVNKFVEGESYNPGRGAYYLLMGGCVIAPRLLQAREPDEFREILTRDVITVLTILFAMKGLKSGMCASAQKKAGMVLVSDTVGKNAGKLKRLSGYFNPEGGISALNSQEILARYSGIKSKDELANMLSTVDKEGGNIAKMFSIEKNEGIIQKIKNGLTGKTSKETPLYDAAKKMFGGDFSSKTNAELINQVKEITEKSGSAYEGMKEIIGSNALESTVGEAANSVKEGILNGKKNPLTYYARNLSSNFTTLSLAITAGFLGFGLPKFNEKLTKKRHLNQPEMTSSNRITQTKPEQKQGSVYNVINANDTFKNFSIKA